MTFKPLVWPSVDTQTQEKEPTMDYWDDFDPTEEFSENDLHDAGHDLTPDHYFDHQIICPPGAFPSDIPFSKDEAEERNMSRIFDGKRPDHF